MEPAEATLTFRALVTKVEERFRRKWISGVGQDATFKEESLGWYISLEGSYESLFTGYAKPEARLGTVATIRISFPCPPSQTTNPATSP